MIKLIILISLLTLSSSTFAATEVGFFETIGSTIQGISDFFIVEIPNFVSGVYATLVQWYVLAKIKGMIWSVQFSHSVAQSLIQDFSVTQHLQTALSKIPGNIGYYLNILNVPDLIMLLIEAYTTRFVMTIRGM